MVELVAVATRPIGGNLPLLSREECVREVEDLIAQFEVVYPNEQVVRLALRGMAAYQLSWFDAHLWAAAEHFGMKEILSEDFQDGRHYGTVHVRNPFSA